MMRLRAALSVCLVGFLAAGCGSSASVVGSGDLDGPWLVAVQPSEIHHAYVAKADMHPVDLPDCAVDSDREHPVLSSDGTSIALQGCWDPEANGTGSYETLVVRQRTLRRIKSIIGAVAWVGTTPLLVGNGEDQDIRLVDTSKEADAGRSLATVAGAVRSIDVDPTGRFAAVVHGGREVVRGQKVTLSGTRLVVVSIADGDTRSMPAPDDAVNAQWGPGGTIVVETFDRWVTLDSESGNVAAQRSRPRTTVVEDGGRMTLRCHLAAVSTRSTVGWCPATSELLIESTDEAEARRVRLPDARPLGGVVSVATGLVDRYWG